MALSANTTLETRVRNGMSKRTFTVLTSAVIYDRALCVITAAGLLKPAADETTTTFVGMAIESSSGSFPVTGDGAYTVSVLEEIEIKAPLATAVTVGDTNKTALYLVDDQTITTANTLGPACGTMRQFVAANSGWVFIRSGLGAAS